jgi:exosortase K
MNTTWVDSLGVGRFTQGNARTASSASGYGRTDVALLSLVLAAAYLVKRHYSTASAEELGWALVPTTYFVEKLTGLHFTFERGAGFVSESRRLVIAPACAGVNFFVIALSSLSFSFIGEVRGLRRKALLVVASALSAYIAMLVVNATRISLGAVLAPHLGLAGDAFRHQLHRVEGVVTYLTSLWLLMSAGRSLSKVIGR